MKKIGCVQCVIWVLASFFTGCGGDDDTCQYEDWHVNGGEFFWCDDEGVRTTCTYNNTKKARPCPDGESCYMTSSEYARCIENVVGESCDGRDERVCDGDRVVECKDGVYVVSEDCFAQNKRCSSYATLEGPGCVESCSYKELGSTVTKCSSDGSSIKKLECSGGMYELLDVIEYCSLDEVCENSKCVPAPKCKKDTCDGNVLKMCSDHGYSGYYKDTRDCTLENAICYVENDSGYGDCYEKCPDGVDAISFCENDWLMRYPCIQTGDQKIKSDRYTETHCEHGCDNNQCKKIIDVEGEACHEGESRCEGDIVLSCNQGIWQAFNCSDEGYEGYHCFETFEQDGEIMSARCYPSDMKPCDSPLVTATMCGEHLEFMCKYDDFEKCYNEQTERIDDAWINYAYPAVNYNTCLQASDGQYYWVKSEYDYELCEQSCSDNACINHELVDAECSVFSDSDVCDGNTLLYCDRGDYDFQPCLEGFVCGTYAYDSNGRRNGACMEECSNIGEMRGFQCKEDAVTAEDEFPVRSYREVCRHFDVEDVDGWHDENERCWHGCNYDTGKCQHIHDEEGNTCVQGSQTCDDEMNMALMCYAGYVRADKCENGLKCAVVGRNYQYCLEPCDEEGKGRNGECLDDKRILYGETCQPDEAGHLFWQENNQFSACDGSCVGGKCVTDAQNKYILYYI